MIEWKLDYILQRLFIFALIFLIGFHSSFIVFYYYCKNIKSKEVQYIDRYIYKYPKPQISIETTKGIPIKSSKINCSDIELVFDEYGSYLYGLPDEPENMKYFESNLWHFSIQYCLEHDLYKESSVEEF